MLRLIRLLLAIVATLVIVDLAVVNRAPVNVSFWPLPYAQEIPLFLVSATLLVLGAVMGGVATWLGAWPTRARAYRDHRRLIALEARQRQQSEREAATENERQRQRRASLSLTAAHQR